MMRKKLRPSTRRCTTPAGCHVRKVVIAAAAILCLSTIAVSHAATKSPKDEFPYFIEAPAPLIRDLLTDKTRIDGNPPSPFSPKLSLFGANKIAPLEIPYTEEKAGPGEGFAQEVGSGTVATGKGMELLLGDPPASRRDTYDVGLFAVKHNNPQAFAWPGEIKAFFDFDPESMGTNPYSGHPIRVTEYERANDDCSYEIRISIVQEGESDLLPRPLDGGDGDLVVSLLAVVGMQHVGGDPNNNWAVSDSLAPYSSFVVETARGEAYAGQGSSWSLVDFYNFGVEDGTHAGPNAVDGLHNTWYLPQSFGYGINRFDFVYKIVPTSESTGSLCGNGILECPEQCDDGNGDEGDGCQNDCTASVGACCVYGTCTDDIAGEDCLEAWYPGKSCEEVTCPPANDDCDHVIGLADGTSPFALSDGLTEFDLTSATTDGPELADDAFAYGENDQIWSDVWYTYEATCDGTIVIDTCLDSLVDTRLALYDGWGCPTTEENDPLVSDDDGCGGPPWQSALAWPTSLGEQYLVRLGAFREYSYVGPGVIRVQCVEPGCGNGIKEGGEECDDGNTINGDGCESDCTISPDECGNGVFEEWAEECEDGNTIDDDGCEGDCTIKPPVNETCDEAKPITLNAALTIDNTHATTEAGEPAPPCRTFAEGDVWYMVTPDVTGDMGIEVLGPPGVTLAVYEGTCGNLNVLSCDAYPPRDGVYGIGQCLAVDAGTTYYIQIASWDNSARGSYTLAVRNPCGVCGDGIANIGEACDDGNLIDGDGCQSDCTLTPVCGNGLVEQGEECDDGNDKDGDGCDSVCMFEPPENDTCDDRIGLGLGVCFAGETTYAHTSTTPPCETPDTSGDVWYGVDGTGGMLTASTCTNETDFNTELTVYCLGCDTVRCVDVEDLSYDRECGWYSTGVEAKVAWCSEAGVEYLIRVHGYGSERGPFEICIGQTADSCDNPPNCADPYCGDGYVESYWDGGLFVVEECEDNNTVNGDGCDNDCMVSFSSCGNGIPEWDEACDDGNSMSGDGCENDCTFTAACGNGQLDYGEECDDGNVANGDGCTWDCQYEPPPNDWVYNQIEIFNGTTAWTLNGATTDGPVHEPCNFEFGVNQIYNDIWFSYTATATGWLRVHTCGGTEVDTRLAVYDMTQPPVIPFHPVVCNDDFEGCGYQSSVWWRVVDDEDYIIRLGTFAETSTTGPGELYVEFHDRGACCEDGACTDDLTEAACGFGQWFPGESCSDDGFCCPPSNDGIDYAAAWYGLEGIGQPFDTCGSTIDPETSGPCTWPLKEDIWFDFTATCGPGMFTLIDTCGDDEDGPDTVIQVYEGCDYDIGADDTIIMPDTLACGDDDGCGLYGYASRVAFQADFGACYKIRLGGWFGDDVAGDLNVTCIDVGQCGDGVVSALAGEECDDGNTLDGDGCDHLCQITGPPNDSCEEDLPITIDDGATPFFTNYGSTDGPEAPECSFGSTDQIHADVWFEYSATCDGTLTIDTCVTDGDTRLAVYEGAACPSSGDESIVCNDDDWSYCGGGGLNHGSKVEIRDVEFGDVYKVRIGSYWDTVYAEGLVNVTCTPNLGVACPGGHLDCVEANNNCCEWNSCGGGIDPVCQPPVPVMFGDVCGPAFDLPPNGTVNLTDILCTLDAFGAANLVNCWNADVASMNPSDCPRGNGIVNLTDILKVLDAFGAPVSPAAEFYCDCPLNP